jgi:hypothetical protein
LCDALLELLAELLGLYLVSRQPLLRVLRGQTGAQLVCFSFTVPDLALGSALQVGQKACQCLALLAQCVTGMT